MSTPKPQSLRIILPSSAPTVRSAHIPILHALLEPEKQFNSIRCFIPPGSGLDIDGKTDKRISAHTFDLKDLEINGLAANLKGVDCVVSALHGPALEAQPTIQDAAAKAGVERLYPSEYGLHNIYRKPDDPQGYVHPLWDMKARLNEQVVLHPVVRQGKMSFTIIGCGDFYNQDREAVWCPWTQRPEDVSEYVVHAIGDPDAEADFTHLDDFAKFLVATVCEPEKSRDQFLNFVSDTISHRKIVGLMDKDTGKLVRLENISFDKMHTVIAGGSEALEELRRHSVFPVDFWFLVKGTQGQGRFVRPRSQIHISLFPQVRVTTFEDYLHTRRHG